eukprot:TRINITY_DN36568_c0_g1_i2.p1 TRINITY_DN36568_c0_g1~~TRINITY_DN36568_c0_g1_i2.p1  ORF type:complete len:392 (+),score=-2.33 TRINITY_DN36568_c0_g1_i2:354-1529(+)
MDFSTQPNNLCQWSTISNRCRRDSNKMISLLTNNPKPFGYMMRCGYASTRSACTSMRPSTCVWDKGACHVDANYLVTQMNSCFDRQFYQTTQIKVDKCKNQLTASVKGKLWVDRDVVTPATECADYITFFAMEPSTCDIIEHSLDCTRNYAYLRYSYCTNVYDKNSQYMKALQVTKDIAYLMGTQNDAIPLKLSALENFLGLTEGTFQSYEDCDNLSKYQCTDSSVSEQGQSEQTKRNGDKNKKWSGATKAIIVCCTCFLFITFLGAIYGRQWWRQHNENRRTVQDVEAGELANNGQPEDSQALVPATTENIVNNLKSHEFMQAQSEVTCAICLEELRDGQRTTSLGCNHKFHKLCISQWILTKGKAVQCPLCKSEMAKMVGHTEESAESP